MNSIFPKSFLWGASTSGFQVEGGSEYRSIANSDMRKIPRGLSDYKTASDHYHHIEEDVALMKELGMKVYRFSFMWSRIMKDGEEKDEEGIRFYHKLIDLLIEANIKPFPTLYHFEMPYELIEKYGGWLSLKTVEAYEKYARICFEEFGDKVKLWATINEQMCATAPDDMNGNLEEDSVKRKRNLYQMSYNMTLAEKKAIKLFRDIIPDGKIGHVVAMQVIYPLTSSPEDNLASLNAKDEIQFSFLDLSIRGEYSYHFKKWIKDLSIDNTEDELMVKYKPDFIGVNYYASIAVRKKKESDDDSYLPPFYQSDQFFVVDNPYQEKTEWMHFGVDNLGLYIGIRELYDRYQLPIIITENGMAYSDKLEDDKTIHDQYRIEYLKGHIQEVYKLIDEGYPIFGYCMWSFIDVVSSHEGFAKRYGLVYVDRTNKEIKNCRRYKKDSFYWYQKIIKNGGLI